MALAFILLLLFTGIVYGKYVITEKLISTTSVAKPIFIIEGQETTKINEINNIGYYEFSIKNFNETDISDIGFLYTIEIISDLDENVKFELYNTEIQIPLENLKTQELSICGNEKVEQKYKLKVIYDNTNLDKENDISEEVQIKVHSEQEKI